jgi:lipopolysaccharide/colanic/teichoic acid biosynthesis glycosyltransferase
MKPGITGLWQLRGNAAVSDFEEIVGLDCHYIDNWSLFLDLKVLLATVFLSIRGNGC